MLEGRNRSPYAPSGSAWASTGDSSSTAAESVRGPAPRRQGQGPGIRRWGTWGEARSVVALRLAGERPAFPASTARALAHAVADARG